MKKIFVAIVLLTATVLFYSCKNPADAKEKDSLAIRDVTVSGTLVSGIETHVVIQVDYKLVTQEAAQITVYFNDQKINGKNEFRTDDRAF